MSPDLAAVAWVKTRRLLVLRESFTFFDQIARQLNALGLDPEVFGVLLDLEGLRRQPWRDSVTTRAWALARVVPLSKAGSDWPAESRIVAGVLRGGVWRASSLVECLDSVARMQQARHRKMTQGLLDLKRLYWTCVASGRVVAKTRRPLAWWA